MISNQTLPSQKRSHAVATLLALLTIVFLTAASFAFSAQTDLTVHQAYSKMQEQSLVLIDVRTQPEWAETGIAAGATPISMRDPQFLTRLAQLQTENPGADFAFICASGRRSAAVQAELARRGFDHMYSVFGGTTGSSQAPGWIGEGLPIVPWTAN